MDNAAAIFTSGDAHMDEAGWHQAATLLRRERPIAWVEGDEFYPFWALTKHADVLEVELHPGEFLSEPRTILGTREGDDQREVQGHLVKSLVQMDDPEHRNHRNLTADWFLPENLAKLDHRLRVLADRSLARMRELDGECDCAADIAMQYPLHVVPAILGLPESDYDRMLRLTQEIFAPADDDFKRDDDALASVMASVADLVAYFTLT